MNFPLIFAYLQAVGMNLEWTTSDGRTFQIAGNRQIAGYYERFFPPKSGMNHPTRRNLGEQEAKMAFLAVETYKLYSHRLDDGEDVTREQLYDKIEGLFPGSKRGQ